MTVLSLLTLIASIHALAFTLIHFVPSYKSPTAPTDSPDRPLEKPYTFEYTAKPRSKNIRLAARRRLLTMQSEREETIKRFESQRQAHDRIENLKPTRHPSKTRSLKISRKRVHYFNINSALPDFLRTA